MVDMDVQVKFTSDTVEAREGIADISDGLEDVQTTAESASTALDAATKSGDELDTAMTSAGGASDDAAGSLKKVKDSSDEATDSIGGLNKESEKLEKKSAPAARSFRDSLDSLERSAKKLGRELTALVTGPIAAIAAVSLKNLYDKGAMEGSSFAARDFALAVQGLRDNFKLLTDEIATRLLPTVMKIIGVFNTVINAYRGLSSETKNMIMQFAGIAAIIGPAILAFSTLASVFVKLMPVFVAIGNGLAAFAAALATPTALIVALGVTIAGLINVFMKLRQAGVETADALKLAFNLFVTGFNNYVVGTILSGVSLIIKGLSSLASKIAPALKDGLDSAAKEVDSWNQTLKARFDATKGTIDESLKSVGSSAGDAFTFGLSTSLSNLTAELQKAFDNASKNINMSSLTDAEKEAQRKGFENAMEEYERLQQGIRMRAQAIGESISGNLSDAFIAFADGSKTAGEAFADFAKQTVANLVKIATQAAIMNALFPPGSPIGNLLGSFAAATATKSYATGGPVIGPGTGTSDSILANVSNGEYVIRAAAVKKYGRGFFDNINSMVGGLPIPVKSTRPSFADGGMVTAPGQAPSVVIENKGSNKEVVSSTFDPATQVTKIVLDDINRNGPIAKSMQTTFGTRRGGFQ